MKLLQNQTFEAINTALSSQRENIIINGTIESYSCKMTCNDKKLYKTIHEDGRRPSDLQMLSPSESEQQTPGVSPVSSSSLDPFLFTETDSPLPPVAVISRKRLFTLLSTLNASFPDYDFSAAKSEDFSREQNLSFVINDVNSNLTSSLGEKFVALSCDMWRAIDDEICLCDCEIYSYNPDMESDPFGDEGCLWTFNYLFFNKDIKRVVFFNCHAKTHAHFSYTDDECERGSGHWQMEWTEMDHEKDILVY